MGDHVIETRNLTKTYKMGSVEVHACAGGEFHHRAGRGRVHHGPSGSGKSTLMNLLAAWTADQPASTTWMENDEFLN
jgi:putative ABC transport system ATP-binding protein